MRQEYAKRFLTKDGKKRLIIYQQEYPEDPRDMTDEPLHCEDWSANCSIMNKQERESKSSSARNLLEYLLYKFGDYKKIIDFLVENGKHITDGYCKSNDALVYNKSEHRWDLMSYMLHYNSETRENEMGWCLNNHYYEKKYYLDLDELLGDVCDSTIDYLAQTFFTDKVKIASYVFGYYGEISFYNSFSTDSEGICWLEKDEFLKYSGNDEKYWKSKTLREIEWLCGEIEAWSNNEVYGFVVEEAKTYHIIKKPHDDDEEPIEYDETEWNETDSCWGFYGELDDEHIGYILEQAGFKKDELDEA